MMEGIDVNLSLRASEHKVMADSNQLQQVFLNIMMNAADAMSKEGADGNGEPRTLRIESFNNGEFIELRFADSGPGVNKEDLNHIFDPFYTTKEPGLGTGLGLSVCYRIVEGLGGTICAESPPGKGMTIIVKLPLISEREKQKEG
jgi:signal transduction histidine kinase